MDADTIRAGLKSHDRALYIKVGWIRDPYITLGPDDYYYLTGTQPREGNPREANNPYNIGLGDDGQRRLLIMTQVKIKLNEGDLPAAGKVYQKLKKLAPQSEEVIEARELTKAAVIRGK